MVFAWTSGVRSALWALSFVLVPRKAHGPKHKAAMTYTPLWTKSNFSFLEGASHPSELIERAHELGLDSIALTDRDGVYGLVRGHVAARESGIRLILGSQVTVQGSDRIVLLAQNREGYANLCRLLTKGRLRCKKGESVVSWEEVCAHAEGLIALRDEGMRWRSATSRRCASTITSSAQRWRAMSA